MPPKSGKHASDPEPEPAATGFGDPVPPFGGEEPPGAPVDFAHPRDSTAPGYDADNIPEEEPALPEGWGATE